MGGNAGGPAGRQHRFGGDPLRPQGAEHPGIERGVDGGYRYPHFQGTHHSPKASSLLPRRIDDQLDQIATPFWILGGQADLGDLHKKGSQLLGLVPAP